MAVFLVLAAFAVLIYNSPSNTTVPDVAGQTVAEARATIEAKDLVVGEEKEENSDSVASGHVIKTDPQAGSQRRKVAK